VLVSICGEKPRLESGPFFVEVVSGSVLFLQRDPFGYEDSVNLYAGLANDPVNLRDPTGTRTFADCDIEPTVWLRLDCRNGRDVADARVPELHKILEGRGLTFDPVREYPGSKSDWEAWDAWEDLRRWNHGISWNEAGSAMILPSGGPALLMGSLKGLLQTRQMLAKSGREVAGTKDGPSRPPFNPTDGRRNCVGAVCAFLRSVTEHTLVEATKEVWPNGGSIRTALKLIRDRTNVKTSLPKFVQFNTLETAHKRQFFIVFKGTDPEISDHVAVGIFNNGRARIYDPQSHQLYDDIREFGPFQAYPVTLPEEP
jgi:hypothetical protein